MKNCSLATAERPETALRRRGNIIYFRTLQDYRRLARDVRAKRALGVIAGVMGSEIAARPE